MQDLELICFGPFIENISNADAVAAGTYGINNLVDGTFVTLQIAESEISNYRFVHVDFDDAIIVEINNTNPDFPFVELKS